MKSKIVVGLLSVAVIAFVLVYYFNYDGPDNVMSGGTLVSAVTNL